MFLPLGDEPNPRTVPYVTTFLLVANIGVWCLLCLPYTHTTLRWDTVGMPEYLRLMHEATGTDRVTLFRHASAYDLMTFRWGFRPSAPSFVTLCTSIFLHAGWLHLGGNMLFLWIFGNNVEARLGPARYLTTYLCCGFVATLTYAAFQADSTLPLIGASGAISGILGCYFVWFPRYRVRVLAVWIIFWQRINMPAWLVLSFYLLVENLLPLLASDASHGAGVAHGAHVGGFAAGAAYALARQQGWLRLLPKALVQTEAQLRHRAATVRRWLREGAFEDAWSNFLRLPPPSGAHVSFNDVLLLADWLTKESNFAQAQTLLAECAQLRAVNDPQLAAQLALRQGLLAWRGQKRPQLARDYLQRALAHAGGEGPVADAARQALEALQWVR